MENSPQNIGGNTDNFYGVLTAPSRYVSEKKKIRCQTLRRALRHNNFFNDERPNSDYKSKRSSPWVAVINHWDPDLAMKFPA